jgi:hypothetical protein
MEEQVNLPYLASVQQSPGAAFVARQGIVDVVFKTKSQMHDALSEVPRIHDPGIYEPIALAKYTPKHWYSRADFTMDL